MQSFFKTLFASTLGVIIAFVVMGFLSFLMIALITFFGSSTYEVEDKTILSLDLNGVVTEREADKPLASLLSGSGNIGLDDITDAIRKAKENDKIKGIYIKGGNFGSGIADLEPIRKELLDFKESGKFIVSYADNYTQGTYYLSSVADKIILNPEGSVDFHGLASVPVFVKNMYEKIGVRFQVFKVGTFKSAVEPYIQEQMSEANRLQTQSYLNDIWSHILQGISASRNISTEQLNAYADKCLTFMEADSVRLYGMVDTLMYSTGVEDYLKGLVHIDQDDDLKLATINDMKTVAFKNEKADDNKIAVLYAEGVIIGDEEGSSPFSFENTITAKEFVKELKELKEDDDVKAVVFRVNSPGGSAYASEQIWNAVSELREVKPVIVSMGTYAASGGYYISCGADEIIAEPTTITGSIGIFGLIPDGTELAEKMGLSFDEVKTNKHSAFGGSTFGIPFLVSAQSRGMTEEESRMLQRYVEKGYDLFITRCADGRGMTKNQIDSIGQGRVWTGNQAMAIGLVDKLGNVDDAIQSAAAWAEVEHYNVEKYPQKKDFLTQLLEESIGGAKVKVLKFLMGENEYEKHMIKESLKNTDIRMAVMPDNIFF